MDLDDCYKPRYLYECYNVVGAYKTPLRITITIIICRVEYSVRVLYV